MMNERYYTIEEWADILDVSTHTIYSWMRAIRTRDGFKIILDEDRHYRIYISESTMAEITLDNNRRGDFISRKLINVEHQRIIDTLDRLEDSLYNECLVIEELRTKIERMGL